MAAGLADENKDVSAIAAKALVDLGAVTFVGHAPEMEDYRFNQWKVRRLQEVSAGEFWRLLQAAAQWFKEFVSE